MAIDMKVVESRLRSKKGLMERLGDVGHFLTNLFSGGDLSKAAIEKTINNLTQYLATCSDQIDDLGKQWLRVYQRIKDLKQETNNAPPPIKKILLVQAEIAFRQYDG
ncbi:MAG: hypothetical protein DRG83_19795, partial [Deltaproteobacteria bacterium]